MASFCGNCGGALGENVVFCSRCGARQAASAASSVPVQATAAKGGSGLKILMIVVVCFVVLAGLAVAGVVYAAHRVKQAVVSQAATYGVDLKSTTSTTPAASSSLPANICDLVSKAQMSELLGEPIDRTENDGGSCLYYGPPGLAAKLGQDGAAETMKKAQAGKEVSGAEVADSMTKMLGAAAAAAGNGGSRGDVPLLTLVIGDDGKSQMAAMGILGGGVAKMDAMRGAEEEIPGLGDKAIRLANLGLNVLKGDRIIRVVPGPVPDANRKIIEVARAVLPKI